jgi:hypothetical protein
LAAAALKKQRPEQQAESVPILVRPVPTDDGPVLNYILGLAFLVCLEAILVFLGNSFVKKVAAIAILVPGMLSLLYIIILYLHWYVNPLPFFALALLLGALAPDPTQRREILGKHRAR